MFNILLLENDTSRCRDIINSIQSSNLNAKIYNIAFSENDAKQILFNNNIHILILGINSCSENFFEFISNNFSTKLKKSIILYIFNNTIPDYVYKYQKFIYKLIVNTKSQKLILLSLNNLIHSKDTYNNDIKLLINKELEYIGFNFSYVGTKYLSETIYIIYIQRLKKYDLQNIIYPAVSKAFNTSISNIKSSIFKSTDIAYENAKVEKINSYFGRKMIVKPRTKEIIDIIIKNIYKKG